MEVVSDGDPLLTLPASVFLVSLRNAIAHGDDRRVAPLHMRGKGADRRLVGFTLKTEFYDSKQKSFGQASEPPRWGICRVSLTTVDLRRIGLALTGLFRDQMNPYSQNDARRHVSLGQFTLGPGPVAEEISSAGQR